MAFQWAGWTDTVIEVRYTAGAEQWMEWAEAVRGIASATVLPTASGGPVMDALWPEHQQESSAFVRVAGPPLSCMLAMQTLLQVCETHLSTPEAHEPPASER